MIRPFWQLWILRYTFDCFNLFISGNWHYFYSGHQFYRIWFG